MFRPIHPRIHNPRSRRAAFTLVEMLVVMGIIAILLAALLPAVRGINQASGRRGAVGSVMGTLDRARMMAISDGLATYFVVAAKPSASAIGSINPALWGQAYAIFQEKDNITFQLVQRTPWIMLPTGMAFKVSAVGSSLPSMTLRDTGFNKWTQNKDPQFPLAGTALQNGASSPAQLPYLKFDTTGTLETPQPYVWSDQSACVWLFPGQVSANGAEAFTQNSSGTSQIALLEKINVQPSTGRAAYVVNPADNSASPSPTP